MINTSEDKAIALAICRCSACHASIRKRPYFRMETGWFCDACLAQYSVHELQVRIGRNKLHGQLCC
jgi:hypothetical protein